VLLSNRVASAKKALELYRAKDVVEKGFWRLKNALDLRRIRVHSQESMQNKIFIGFIAFILLSYMNRIMAQNKMYRDMTMKDMLFILKKLRIQTIADEKILFPVTREQRRIFEAFSVSPPV
jgi:transposase